MSKPERTVMFSLPTTLQGNLACLEGTLVGRSWELSAGTFKIGRVDDNDLAMPQEPGVSKQHAKVIGQGDSYEVVDLESRNGTFVNGVAIQRARLRDGDEIRICGCLLRFTQKGGQVQVRNEAPPEALDVDEMPATRPGIPAFAPSQPPMALQPAAATPPRAPSSAYAPSQPPSAGFAAVSAPPSYAPPSYGPPHAPAQAFAPPTTGIALAPPPPAPARSHGRVLAAWYGAGFAGSLLLGGAAAFVAVPDAPAPVVEAAAAQPTPAPTPVPTPAPAPTAPPQAPQSPDAAGGVVEGAGAPPSGDPASAPAAGTPAAQPGALPADKPVEPAAVDTPADARADKAPAEAVAPPAPKAVDVAAARKSVERKSAAATADAAAQPATDDGKSYPVSVDGGKVDAVKTKSGGKVASVGAQDGATVSKGDTLVTFDVGGAEEEVATLQDRIASLESAEDEDAKRELKAARQKLSALQASKGAVPVVAPASGKLQGFSVSSGDVLKPGATIGRIVDGDVPTRVRATVDRNAKVKTGASATLTLKNGSTIEGTVVSVSGRNVVIATGGEPGDSVESVRF